MCVCVMMFSAELSSCETSLEQYEELIFLLEWVWHLFLAFMFGLDLLYQWQWTFEIQFHGFRNGRAIGHWGKWKWTHNKVLFGGVLEALCCPVFISSVYSTHFLVSERFKKEVSIGTLLHVHMFCEFLFCCEGMLFDWLCFGMCVHACLFPIELIYNYIYTHEHFIRNTIHANI